MSDNIKKQKRIIAEESQSPDRWLREPRNNHHTLRAGKFAVYAASRLSVYYSNSALSRKSLTELIKVLLTICLVFISIT